MAAQPDGQTDSAADCLRCRQHTGPSCSTDACTQTDTTVQGCVPRLSKVNLFTLLSLWMELFPSDETEDTAGHNDTVRGTGAVVVRDGKVLGLHRSGPELHAGQAAVIAHAAPTLAGCQLYFSRRPCSTCLKMLINAGVSQVAFWPGDPEISIMRRGGAGDPQNEDSISQEALLDAVASERLRSNSRPRIGVVPLQPLAPGLPHFIETTSRGSDFMERLREDEPAVDAQELFYRQRRRHLEDFSEHFLVESERRHRYVLGAMRLENFCTEPCFSSLRHNMRELLGALATVAAGLPLLDHGFYDSERCSGAETATPTPHGSSLSQHHHLHHQGGLVSQEVARHCMIQARLLSYRTEDPKVGVGAVIWTQGQSGLCVGTGGLSLLGCGYNAYPSGSQYAEYPQMDDKTPDRQRRKYRYMIHAEQNALTFRSREVRGGEPTLMFVTKCPCDECVPLIAGAGVSHLYTTDQDSGKDKGDISYLRFRHLRGVRKFTWQKACSSSHVANGCVRKHGRQPGDQEKTSCNKRRCCRDRAAPQNTEGGGAGPSCPAQDTEGGAGPSCPTLDTEGGAGPSCPAQDT